MNQAENPYAAPSTSEGKGSTSWAYPMVVAAGPWLAVAAGVALGRLMLGPLFADFDLELPRLTAALLSFYAPFVFIAVGMDFLLIALAMPSERSRRRAALAALVLAIVVGVACLAAFMLPLISLMRALG